MKINNNRSRIDSKLKYLIKYNIIANCEGSHLLENLNCTSSTSSP